jgi:hypothetical protein
MIKQLATRIYTPMNERPRCTIEGCDNAADYINFSKVTGKETFRKLCKPHHSKHTASKHGLATISQVVAKNAGYDSVTAYSNSKHRYRRNRLDYCENSLVGAVWVDLDTGEHKSLLSVIGLCTYVIPEGDLGLAVLSVDHINGNNQDDRIENHQTLCFNCHRIKSILSHDHLSCEQKRKHRENYLKNSTSSLVFG